MRERILKIRSVLGYSKKQLGVALGVTYTAVYCAERNDSKLIGNALSRLLILESALDKDAVLGDLREHPAALAAALELCVATLGSGEIFINSGATMTQVLSGAAGVTLYNSMMQIQKN